MGRKVFVGPGRARIEPEAMEQGSERALVSVATVTYVSYTRRYLRTQFEDAAKSLTRLPRQPVRAHEGALACNVCLAQFKDAVQYMGAGSVWFTRFVCVPGFPLADCNDVDAREGGTLWHVTTYAWEGGTLWHVTTCARA